MNEPEFDIWAFRLTPVSWSTDVVGFLRLGEGAANEAAYAAAMEIRTAGCMVLDGLLNRPQRAT